jgi:hypothetical protein
MAEFKTEGLDELIARMEKLANVGSATAVVGAKPTTGSVKRKTGQESDYRSAGQNVVILRSHAKGMTSKLGNSVPPRKVNFLTAEERSAGLAIWQEAVNKFLVDGIEAGLDAAAKRVGEFMAEKYRQHIRESQGPDGPLEPVKAATQKQKDREVGPGKPPLERTGQLLRSFIAEGIRGR